MQQEEGENQVFERINISGRKPYKNTKSNEQTELQLSVGKTYTNGFGKTVTIISEDSDNIYPFNDDNGESYTEDGRYYSNDVSPLDLKEELNIFIPDHNSSQRCGFGFEDCYTDDTTNPKDLVGSKKPPLSLIPPAGLIHQAMAMKDGADKYGAYNWREKKVQAMIYIDAILRHVQCYLDREDYAHDSKAHHLGHIAACCNILLDATETGNLIDNRPVKGKAAEIIGRLTEC